MPRFSPSLWSYVFSPDGSELASITSESWGTIQLWDATTGEKKQEVWDINLYGGACIAWSLNGNTIATASSKVQIWDRASDDNYFGEVALSANGEVLASSTGDELWAWDIATGQITSKITGLEASIRFLEFSPDEKSIAVVYYSEHASRALILDLERTSMSPSHWLSAEFVTVSFSEGGQLLKGSDGSFLDLNSECFSPEKGSSLQSANDGIFQADADLWDHSCHHCVGAFEQTELLLKNEWLYADGNRILWVPPGYRSNNAVQCNGTIAVGSYESSQVRFIQFDLSMLS
ncbi:unnamed protein product [Penicillium glandicola]